MKYRYLLIGLLSTLALSCTMEEVYSPDDQDGSSSPKNRVFYVSIDEQPDVDTKVYADENLRVRWNKDDRISIFNKDTFNQEYSFQGGDGDNSGEIEPVGAAGEGDALDPEMVYAIYPYQESTSISTAGVISFDMPSIQNYKEKSFGLEANTMVSKTEDNNLKFKNVGGYLVLKMYGANVKVSSIILRGNNNELLAGPSTIVMTEDGPSVSIASATASKQIRLYCKEPVELGQSSVSEECKIFWIVVPPVDFTGGFSVTVATPDGKTFTQSTTKPFSIKRSSVTRLAPFEVIPEESGADIKINEISSNAGGYGISVTDSNGNLYYNKASYDSSTQTFTITLPTVTDFSELVLNYSLAAGDILIVDGKKVQSGVPIDASCPSDDISKPSSKPISLTVCRGDAEKRFTLVARNTGLPVVRINTTGFDRLTVENDRVYVQTGRYGQRTKIDERKWRPSENAVDSSAYVTFVTADGSVIQEYKTQIKGRGNATWKYDKRPYALKLLAKNPVFNMPKHKRWVLLANWKDRTLLRNDAAFWLSRQTVMQDPDDVTKELGLPYTVRGQFVELEFNGEHRGNYYLCEQIKIDKNRVNISEWDPKKDTVNINGGFMMEIDNNFDEANKFKSSQFKLKYMFKDPDDDLTTAATSYMQAFVNNMEVKIKNAQNGQYREDFDIDAAIWFMFVNELTGNGDFYNENYSDEYKGPHSTYLYKDKGGKLTMGPVWDFDYLTFMPSRSSKWAGANQSGYYYKYLCNDPVFKSRLVRLWNLYFSNLSGFNDYIDSMAQKISLSEEFNTQMWGYSNTSQDQGQNEDNEKGFLEAVSLMKDAFRDKKAWMNTKFNQSNFSF